MSIARNWPLTLCGCLEYRDSEGKQRWFPGFCPQAMLCTNVTVGRVWTKLREEKPLPCCPCCGLGLQGTCLCLVTIPLGFYYPIMGMVCFGVISNIMRHQVVKKYGVIEEDYCCMKTPCNYAVNQLHFACNYPCSFFQMDIAMEHWKKEAEITENNYLAPVDVAPPSTNNPVVKEATK